MRTILASISFLLSFAVFGFVAMKWAPGLLKNGLGQTIEELLDSNHKMVVTATLLTLGTLFFCLGVLSGARSRH